MINKNTNVFEWINTGMLILCIIAISFKSTSYNPPAAQNITSRAFTTGFRPSQQRDCIVGYSVVITTSSTLLAGATGQVTLQISPDSTTWTTIMSAQSGLAAGLVNPGTTGSVTVFGLIKAGQWCRLISTNIAGTPSYTTPTGTELSF
jgi:hypothetical protein